MIVDIRPPLNYYTVFHHIQELIPKGKSISMMMKIVFSKIFL